MKTKQLSADMVDHGFVATDNLMIRNNKQGENLYELSPIFELNVLKSVND